MQRLGVYRVRPSKQIFSRTPGSRSLRWDVTEIDGEGDGEGRFTRFVSRTLINQSYDCQRTSQDGLPEGVRKSSADSYTELRGPESLKSPPNQHEKRHTQTRAPPTGLLCDLKGKNTILPTRTLQPNQLHLPQNSWGLWSQKLDIYLTYLGRQP